MNNDQIKCGVCRDLIPLVKDGVASADSEAAVRRHITDCADCGALFKGEFIPAADPSESPKALFRVKRWLTGIYTALMLFGIYFGISLTASDDLFFNCLIMPVVGVFGYLVFRWKALYAVPIILLIFQTIAGVFGFFGETEPFDYRSVLSWAFIYSLFALAGIIIAMLLRFAFGKHNFERSGKNES